MVQTNELFGVLIAALLLLIGPMRPAAAATEDVPLDQIDQEFCKPNLAARRIRACTFGSSKKEGGRCAALFRMSFLRHGEIYHFDEFPAGYSLAG